VDGNGELYLVGYSKGTIVKLVGSPIAPAAPTNVRIIR
jgi:hypothetical protein